MQIECAGAVCIFHFAACVISCSPFRVTEETGKEKQCIHIALGSRRPGRSAINQRSINTAHNVNPALIFKAVDTCNEQYASAEHFLQSGGRCKGRICAKLSISRFSTPPNFSVCSFFPSRYMKRGLYNPWCNESSMSARMLLFPPRAPGETLLVFLKRLILLLSLWGVYMCTWMYVFFIAEALQTKTSCLPVGIAATQEADNQSALARIASN